jgi:Cu/Ag efflux protein CusF
MRKMKLVWLLAGTILAAPALAQEKGEELRGTITDFGPGSMTVRTETRGPLTVRIARRTHVILGNGNAISVDDLKPGMEIRFKFDTEVLDRVHLLSEPPAPAAPSRPQSTPAPIAPEAAREIKARIVSIDMRRGEIGADVAGRTRTFRVPERRLLARAREGDLVILKVDGDTVTGMRSGRTYGRVTSVDRRRREAHIEVDGRDQTFGVDDGALLHRLRPGDRLWFEVEERANGRRVVTGVE